MALKPHDASAEFMEFLDARRRGARGRSAGDARALANWLAGLRHLAESVIEWLRPFRTRGVNATRVQHRVSEPEGATYEAMGVRIRINQDTIDLIPRGRYVFQALGRVDFVYGAKTSSLILESNGEWYFVHSEISRAPTPLNKESLMQKLREMLD